MGWVSIKEFIDQTGVSSSTVRRQIRDRKVRAKKFGHTWFIQSDSSMTGPSNELDRETFTDMIAQSSLAPAREDGNLREVVEFSSKALNHYLMLSEKLIAEKDQRLKEKDEQLSEKAQRVAELESYVEMLESEVTRQATRLRGST